MERRRERTEALSEVTTSGFEAGLLESLCMCVRKSGRAAVGGQLIYAAPLRICDIQDVPPPRGGQINPRGRGRGWWLPGRMGCAVAEWNTKTVSPPSGQYIRRRTIAARHEVPSVWRVRLGRGRHRPRAVLFPGQPPQSFPRRRAWRVQNLHGPYEVLLSQRKKQRHPPLRASSALLVAGETCSSSVCGGESLHSTLYFGAVTTVAYRIARTSLFGSGPIRAWLPSNHQRIQYLLGGGVGVIGAGG